MSQAKWRNFTKEQLEEIIKNSESYREVAIKLGYAPDSGSGVKATKEMIQYYNFNIEHFTGQGWNRNNFDYTRFKYGSVIKVSQALDAIVALRGRRCECCKLERWNDDLIPLEIHHIDGDKLNNVLENLQVLCPNCHAQTDNWRGKNINHKEKKTISEEDFVKALEDSTSIRQALLKLGLSGCGGNYTRAYELITKYEIKKFMKNGL